MQIATTGSVGGSVLAPCSFLGDTCALCGRAGGIGCTVCFLAITAVSSNPLIVDFTSATVGFAPIAAHAK
jgi:hypothetical protein